MLHQWVHGSAFTAAQRWKIVGEANIEVGGDAVEHGEWENSALLSGAQSVLHAARALAVIIGEPEPPELAGLLAEGEAAAEAE